MRRMQHQTSPMFGTIVEGIKKPFKVWFRAAFEIAARKNGMSANKLQRTMGFARPATASSRGGMTTRARWAVLARGGWSCIVRRS